jgi:hypothetical protein
MVLGITNRDVEGQPPQREAAPKNVDKSVPFPFPRRALPEKKNDKGWPIYEQAADGFELAVPADWAAVDLTSKDLDMVMDLAVKANPDFGALAKMVRVQLATGMKFIAMDTKEFGTKFATTVNLVKTPVPPDSTTAAVVDDSLQMLSKLPSVEKPIKREQVKWNGIPAERLRYLMSVTLPDGKKIRVAMIQYALVKDSNVYALSLGTTEGEEKGLAETFQTIAQSFRLIKSKK